MYLANLRNLQVLLDNGGWGWDRFCKAEVRLQNFFECVTLLRAYMCPVQYAYSKVLT